MMTITTDITSLKEQGVADKKIVELIKLKGAKEADIITQLNEFYEKKNATQVTDKPLTSTTDSQLPMLQVIILVLLVLIAGILGWFILAN